MKRFFAALAALAVLFSSCSKDETAAGGFDNGTDAKVTFSLSLESAVQMRTIGDASGVDKLVYAIYNEAGDVVVAKKEVAATFPTSGVQESLAKNQAYTIVLWAQDSDCSAYTVSDDMKVTVNYAGLNNDESRDAFFGSKEFVVAGDMTVTATLKRPFAQVNAGIYDSDWNTAVSLGVTIAESKVEFGQVPSVLNLADGTVSTPVDVAYEFAALPADSLQVDTDNDSIKENFKYLSMSYILAPEAESSVNSMKFTFKPQSGASIVVEEGLAGAPIQRNWRTNIVGSLLTVNVDFAITLDKNFVTPSGDHNISVITQSFNSVETLQDGLEDAAQSVDADGNVYLDYTLAEELPATTNEIVIPEEVQGGNITLTFTEVAQGAKLEVKNDTNADYAGEVVVNVPDNVAVEDVVIDLPNATVTIIGSFGTVTATTGENTLIVEEGAEIETLEIKKGNVVVYGIVKNIVKVAGYEGTVTKYVGTIAAFDELFVANASTLPAIDKVILTNNIVVPETASYTVPASTNLVLDLNGYTLSQTKECTQSHSMITNNGTLTINDSKGGGKISFTDTSAGDPTFGWGSYTLSNYGGTLTINGGTIEHLGQQNKPNQVCHMICAVWHYSGSTIINDGVISTPTYRSARMWTGDMTINGGHMNGQVWVQTIANSPATLTINGGEFNPCGADGSSIFVTNDQSDVTLSVTGGTFATKIGCTYPTNKGVKGAISGGLFTESAAKGTNIALLADGCCFANQGEYYTVDSAAADAQALLDNAAAGTTIYLKEGVNYGTLYLRPVAGKAQTKTVDWQGNDYGFESYSLFEDLTIVGATGATVDAIVIEGGTYYYSAHSQYDLYPVMLSLVELKNVVFDGVTFTGNGGFDPEGYGNVINLSGQNIKVDGLTVKNCVLNNPGNNSRLIYKTEGTEYIHNYTYGGQSYTFTPTLKNITITKTTFNGGYMGLELRETENVTITDNEFNVADRNILLPSNTGCTYSGKILITGNVSNNAKERFVRADGTGDAEVIISGNTLNNYMGADADYIKVTNGNNVTIENNTKN